MCIQVGWICIVFCFELGREILGHVTRIGRIELNDPDVTQRGLSSFLLEAERQPYSADLNCVATTAFGDPRLRQGLRDFETLPFKGVGGNHVDFAETRNASCDRGEVIDVATEPDFSEHLAT